jgi:4-hydroxy-tetrahydrodipicolinate reductase
LKLVSPSLRYGDTVTCVKVAVAGALGRMGREACVALAAAGDCELVGGFSRSAAPSLRAVVGLAKEAGRIYDDVTELYDDARPDIVVDFTRYPVTLDVAREAVDRGISPVVGATGWTDEDEVSFADACDEHGVGAAIVPNFAIGATLALRFALEAARWFPTAEIVELHHDGKRDAPSGTAKLTAKRIAEVAGRETVPVHSVRLRGLVAHQETLFGGEGELLTIRHDALSRASFMPGMLLAVRGVRAQKKLVIGLDAFLPVSAA